MAGISVNKTMGSGEWAMLGALAVLWGSSFLFIGVAVAELPPLTVVFLRSGLAALALWLFLGVLGVAMPRDGKAWAAFLGMGVLNNVIPHCLIAWGQTHIASGVASILNATAPLFTVIIAHVLTRDERMTAWRLVGVILGFVGVAIMIGGAALQSPGVGVLAELAILCAAISYAFAGVFGRRFSAMGIAPMATATGQLTASTILLLPAMLVVDAPWTLPMPSGNAIAAVLGLAIISNAIGYILYFRVLATAGATNLLLVTFLIPVSAILLGAVVLGERLEPKHFVGMALIGAGLVAIDGRPIRWARGLVAPKKPWAGGRDGERI